MPLTSPRFDTDEGDQCSRLLESVKDISSHLDVTALCHKIFLHIHGLVSANRYSLFLVSEDSSNDKFLISRLFDVAGGSTLEEASNNCICLEWNKGIVGHVAALGEPLNIKNAYEKRKKKNSLLLSPFHCNSAFPAQAPNILQVFIELFNFSFFSSTGQGIALDCCDIEWFALDMNRNPSVVLRLHPSTAFQTLLWTMMAAPFLLRDSCPQ
ncbi:unnamed protein product [Rangifer tarandus platyrhynchus]|uniref:Uncharacterized protein n=1 Tax=Rangifer tarandus platyrhynchus TaxID=3082113 RepID=A0ABN9A7Z4_RANTA|nr:unnamed protein product [Rangifer tarandus platyrhynchus]CAI9181599.1 unnamed protein product [Rangifer tarandus platyrhynchus]